MAILLYAGIVTDTGSFRYDCTTARTHEIAGELLRFNLSVSNLYDQLYVGIPVKELKIFSRLVDRAQLLYANQVACIEMPKAVQKKFSGEFDVRDRIFSFLRSVEGIEVIVIFTEQEPNITRANFRSLGKFDVARLAAHFGGGGHAKASGCSIKGNIKQAKHTVLAAIRKGL